MKERKRIHLNISMVAVFNFAVDWKELKFKILKNNEKEITTINLIENRKYLKWKHSMREREKLHFNAFFPL